MGEDLKRCPVCNSEMGKYVRGLFDDRYGYPGLYNLLKCKNCNHLSLDKFFSAKELCELYTEYYPRKKLRIEDYTPSKPAKGFLGWLKGEKRSAYLWVPENVRVLDIGCGFGQTLGYHRNRNCEVYGVEADENIRKVVDQYGFNVHVGLFNPEHYQDGFFDYVTMDQVIEHDQDLMRDLKGIHRILKKGGRLVMSSPNAFGWGVKVFGKRWINWHTPYHNNFVSKKSIRVMAGEIGFEIESAKTLTSSFWLYSQICHLVMFPRKGKKSKLWNEKKGLRDKIILLPVIVMHKLGVLALITRIMDVAALGDNYLIILKK
jgi:SAM-dependent methyltransferase